MNWVMVPLCKVARSCLHLTSVSLTLMERFATAKLIE